jgi:sn-glycerol 3-phosphate transport system substrate-binding protein
MKDTGEAFDPGAFLPAVKSYYTTAAGEMLSLPFNSSTPVLWYNKDAFKKAGLDPDKPPATWPLMEEASKKLLAAGSRSGFTTTWPSWIQIENFSAWHNLPMGTLANGFEGLGTRFVFNKTKAVMQTEKLAEWQRTKIFDYGGRAGAASPKFYSEDAGMMTESSAGLAGVKSSAKFAFGIGFLPYWPSIEGAPQNTIIGGASLWTLRGHPKEDYKAVAAFFTYLSSPEVQAWWHQETGYLPITTAAYELSRKQGYYEKNPGTDISIKQMTLHPPTANSKGIRFGNMVQIRDVINEEQERAFAGKATAQEAMDAAVKRGNAILEQFQEQNS